MLKNANDNHYRAVIYLLSSIFADYIDESGHIDLEDLTPTKIDSILDKFGIDIDFGVVPPP